MIPKMISTCSFKTFFLGKQNALTFSQRIFILELTPNMEMIKETRIKIALTAFTLDQCINILPIKSSELESLILFHFVR